MVSYVEHLQWCSGWRELCDRAFSDVLPPTGLRWYGNLEGRRESFDATESADCHQDGLGAVILWERLGSELRS
ncbi:MAG: hypothetical protein KatS3mg111_0286 [Pirellulaceae bacterium]|nr:MAG: hypothetical protein KatS3mg111_0286 [Pirellulaceae bacterium]